MLIQTLQSLFERDLKKLKSEIEQYKKESNIWRIEPHIANSAGNLCLHLVGNLNAFIGADIGKTGYVRQRDLEFSLRDVPQNELITQIENTIKVVRQALDTLTEKDLEEECLSRVFPEKVTIGYFLVHLAIHLGYHLGQVNYHRRLLDV